MWPWEHLALGYLCYAALRRLRGGGPPTDAAALTVALATQLPDLVDKPLAWALQVLPSGASLGHSVLFGVPLVGAVSLLALRRGAPEVGPAFAVGYGTHLLGDVVYPALVGGSIAPGKLLWPLVSTGTAPTEPLIVTVGSLLGAFGAFLGTPRGRYYLLAELVVLGVVLAWWLYDGAPGGRPLWRSLARR